MSLTLAFCACSLPNSFAVADEEPPSFTDPPPGTSPPGSPCPGKPAGYPISLRGFPKARIQCLCRHSREPRITSGAGAGIQVCQSFSGPPPARGRLLKGLGHALSKQRRCQSALRQAPSKRGHPTFMRDTLSGISFGFSPESQACYWGPKLRDLGGSQSRNALFSPSFLSGCRVS